MGVRGVLGAGVGVEVVVVVVLAAVVVAAAAAGNVGGGRADVGLKENKGHLQTSFTPIKGPTQPVTPSPPSPRPHTRPRHLTPLHVSRGYPKDVTQRGILEESYKQETEGIITGDSGRISRWQGRRDSPFEDYDALEEEVLEGVESGDPNALLPDPTGPAVDVLEKRLHHTAIRHRNGRRNFIRTRKSPKMHPRSKPDDAEGAPPFQITWQDQEEKEQEDDDDREEEKNQDQNRKKEEKEEDKKREEVIQSTVSTFPWSSGAPNLENKFRAMGDLVPTWEAGTDGTDGDLEGDQDTWGDDKEEASVDVVTKFLRIVESQHLLGENCTKGTDFHLGEGVVDRYAQERFRLEGEIAVNRANLYTRLWKYSPLQVLASEYLLHAEVLTMVELDEDIFAAGNCYDKFEYQDYLLYCPFAYRLPEGNILVKDLAVEYKYLSNTSEWFFIARKNAERAINNYTHLTRGKSLEVKEGGRMGGREVR